MSSVVPPCGGGRVPVGSRPLPAGTSGRSVEPVEQRTVVQQPRDYKIDRVITHALDPRQGVVGVLAAVTGPARRDHVAGLGLSAQLDRDDVIERGGRSTAAVGTEPAGRFEQHRLSVGAESSHATTASSGNTPLRAEAAGRVDAPSLGPDVLPAQASAHNIDRKPSPAMAAPGEAPRALLLSLSPGRCVSPLIALAATALQSVAARSVRRVLVARVPISASAAPLLSCCEPCPVVLLGQPEAACSGPDSAIGRARHERSISPAPDRLAVLV